MLDLKKRKIIAGALAILFLIIFLVPFLTWAGVLDDSIWFFRLNIFNARFTDVKTTPQPSSYVARFDSAAEAAEYLSQKLGLRIVQDDAPKSLEGKGGTITTIYAYVAYKPVWTSHYYVFKAGDLPLPHRDSEYVYVSGGAVHVAPGFMFSSRPYPVSRHMYVYMFILAIAFLAVFVFAWDRVWKIMSYGGFVLLLLIPIVSALQVGLSPRLMMFFPGFSWDFLLAWLFIFLVYGVAAARAILDIEWADSEKFRVEYLPKIALSVVVCLLAYAVLGYFAHRDGYWGVYGFWLGALMFAFGLAPYAAADVFAGGTRRAKYSDEMTNVAFGIAIFTLALAAGIVVFLIWTGSVVSIITFGLGRILLIMLALLIAGALGLYGFIAAGFLKGVKIEDFFGCLFLFFMPIYFWFTLLFFVICGIIYAPLAYLFLA